MSQQKHSFYVQIIWLQFFSIFRDGKNDKMRHVFFILLLSLSLNFTNITEFSPFEKQKKVIIPH